VVYTLVSVFQNPGGEMPKRPERGTSQGEGADPAPSSRARIGPTWTHWTFNPRRVLKLLRCNNLKTDLHQTFTGNGA
jgi:hypothetical protein